jgi:cytochrome c biogenesis protein CcdA
MFSQRKTTKLVYIVGTILQIICFVMPFTFVYWSISTPIVSRQDIIGMTRVFYIFYPILIIISSIFLWFQMDKISNPIDKFKKNQ